MERTKWLNLKKLQDEDDFSEELKVGECFIYGTKMTEQLETAQPGDTITYFQVIRINDSNNVEYMPVFDTLEEDKNFIKE